MWREEVDSYLGDGAAGELTARASMRWAESSVHVGMEGGKIPTGAPGVAAALGIYEEWGYASARIVEHDWEEGWLLVESSGTAESRAHLRDGGPSECPVCDMLRGLIAGAYLYLRRRAGLPADDIRAVETSCAAQGHPQCRFAVGSTDTLAAHGVEAPSLDLTSRRELEETLRRSRESESGLQKFVEGMPFGVVEIDTEGRITFANHKTLELVGLPPGRIRGTHFSVHVHPEDQEIVQAEFQKVVEGRAGPYPVQCRLVRADGTSRPCAVDAFPVYDV
ncbi:MAG: PAS domain-containing protein, partial [Planctomycetota bacterium]